MLSLDAQHVLNLVAVSTHRAAGTHRPSHSFERFFAKVYCDSNLERGCGRQRWFDHAQDHKAVRGILGGEWLK